ncbi:hypothetical protein Ac2012v2_002112 [Leucoagaricus gongylophorus]
MPFHVSRPAHPAMKDDESGSQMNLISQGVPMPILIVTIVLGLVGLLLFLAVACWVYYVCRRRRIKSSLVIARKRQGRQDIQPMHVDLEAVADELELEKSKRAVLNTNVDETSPWNSSVDGISKRVEIGDQDDSRVPQMSTLTPKSSFQKYSLLGLSQKPSAITDAIPTTSSHPTPGIRDDAEGITMMRSIRTGQLASERRQSNGAAPRNEFFAVSPSYSTANRLGGVLSRVVNIEILEECRPRTEKDEGTTASSSTLQSTHNHDPSPVSLSRSSLDTIMGIAIPLAGPARSESCISIAITGSYSSSSSIRHVKNDFQTSFGRASATAGHGELPMLMTVINTFVPNLEDELSIQVGETVCMLEEFRDGWCTVHTELGTISNQQQQ